MTDATERQPGDESLRFHAQILENIGEPVIATDPEGKIIYFSRSEAVYGWPAAEVVNRSVFEVTVPETHLAQAREIMDRLRQEQSWSGEFVVRRRDGTTFPAMVAVTTIRDEDGANVATICISKDASALKRAEETRNQALVQRTKELTALHRAAAILQTAASEQSDALAMLQKLAELLPPAFSPPQAVAARIRVGDAEAVTEGFRASPNALCAEFASAGGGRGRVEVVLIGDSPREADQSFTPEQHSLIGTFAEMLHADHERRRTESVLRRRTEELRAHAARITTVREEEATRISREIHDQMGQALTALKMNIAALEFEVASRQGGKTDREIAERIGAMSAAVESALETATKLCTELRPPVLDKLGLVAAIEWAARDFESRSGVFCNLNLPAETTTVEPTRATALFRIFQEILTNIIRHASATEVTIRLAASPDALRLEVNDNGRGLDEGGIESGLGVVGMRERALQFGGRIELRGAIGRGTSVLVEIPNG